MFLASHLCYFDNKLTTWHGKQTNVSMLLGFKCAQMDHVNVETTKNNVKQFSTWNVVINENKKIKF